MNYEQIIDTIPTLNIVKALSKRQGVVCNSVESERIAIGTIMIVAQDDQDEIIKFCSKRFEELDKEMACNE